MANGGPKYRRTRYDSLQCATKTSLLRTTYDVDTRTPNPFNSPEITFRISQLTSPFSEPAWLDGIMGVKQVQI